LLTRDETAAGITAVFAPWPGQKSISNTAYPNYFTASKRAYVPPVAFVENGSNRLLELSTADVPSELTVSGTALISLLWYIFNLPTFKGQTGTGKGHPMKLAPGKWAAQFVPPNQLWISDGLGQVHLYERTIDPSGFKASQSSLVPALMIEAPEELRKIISESNTPEAQAPKK
jgi:hypothetical protein